MKWRRQKNKGTGNIEAWVVGQRNVLKSNLFFVDLVVVVLHISSGMQAGKVVSTAGSLCWFCCPCTCISIRISYIRMWYCSWRSVAFLSAEFTESEKYYMRRGVISPDTG